MAKQSVAIGDLRYSITLQNRTRSTDTGGGFTTSWGTKRTLFGQIKPVTGNSPYDAGRIEHNLTHDVYTRYYSNIDYKANGGQMRISWNDYGTTRILSVKYVYTIEERDRFLLFRCTEGTDEDV
tara:strand:+ start:1069 stop:1440 length:372 start_codon:yes stop_codon:yes gene_type:complete